MLIVLNMQNPNRNKDRSTYHSWINWPNTGTRKCTVCNCICRSTHSNSTGKTVLIYKRDGVISETFIPCKK